MRRAYKIKQVAEIIGCSEISVRRLITRGLLRANRRLRHLLISETEINRFLNE
jgi:excisionase family DNA binding protein